MWIKIKRNNNYSINENGEVRNDLKGTIKRPTLNKSNGYLYLDLYANNERTKVPIHRLVAEAFIPNPDNKPTVDHIDGNRQNNSIENLRWASYSEQNSRFQTHGVRSEKIKASHYIEKLNKRNKTHDTWGSNDIIMFFESITECSEHFKVSIGNISLRLKDGNIGLRGKTRGWLFEYVKTH